MGRVSWARCKGWGGWGALGPQIRPQPLGAATHGWSVPYYVRFMDTDWDDIALYRTGAYAAHRPPGQEGPFMTLHNRQRRPSLFGLPVPNDFTFFQFWYFNPHLKWRRGNYD